MPITEQPGQSPLSNIRTLATLPAVKSPYAQPTYFSLDANDLSFQYASGAIPGCAGADGRALGVTLDCVVEQARRVYHCAV
jgi:hypothetical protein